MAAWLVFVAGLFLAFLISSGGALDVDNAADVCDLPLSVEERGTLLRGLTRTNLETPFQPPFLVIGAYPLASSLILAETVQKLMKRYAGYDNCQIKLTGFKSAPVDLQQGKIHLLVDFRPRAAFPNAPSSVTAFYSDPQVDAIGALGSTSRPGLYISGTLRARIQQAMVKAAVTAGNPNKIAFFRSLDISHPSVTWLKLMDYILSEANIDRSLIPSAIGGYALVPVDDPTLLAATEGSTLIATSGGSSTSGSSASESAKTSDLWSDSFSRICAPPLTLRYALGQSDPPATMPPLVLRPFYKLGLVIGCKLIAGGEETLLDAIREQVAAQGGRKDVMVVFPSDMSLVQSYDRVQAYLSAQKGETFAGQMDWSRFPLPYLSTAVARTAATAGGGAGGSDTSAAASTTSYGATPAPFYTDNTGNDLLTPDIYTSEDSDWPTDMLAKVSWSGLKQFFPHALREGLSAFRWTTRAQMASVDSYELLLSHLASSYFSGSAGLLNAVAADNGMEGGSGAPVDYYKLLANNPAYFDNATGEFKPELAVSDHSTLLKKLDTGVSMLNIEEELGKTVSGALSSIFEVGGVNSDFQEGELVETVASNVMTRRLQSAADVEQAKKDKQREEDEEAAFRWLDKSLFDAEGNLLQEAATAAGETGLEGSGDDGDEVPSLQPPLTPWQETPVEPLPEADVLWWRKYLGLSETTGLPLARQLSSNKDKDKDKDEEDALPAAASPAQRLPRRMPRAPVQPTPLV